MKTNIYLFIISLLLILGQGCVKELHDLPPRPDIAIKLNGVAQDSIIVAPGEEINIEITCSAQQGVLREVVIRDNAGANLPGFPVTLDSIELQNKSIFTYEFKANDYIADRGQTYQIYSFQVICQDDNSPKQLINKTITILIADELNSYTVTLGAQENTEHGGFLNLASGKVYTLEEVRQMTLEELQRIDFCYFWGEEGLAASTQQNFIPLVGAQSYSPSWYYYLTAPEYAEFYKKFSIPAIEQIPVDGNKMTIRFPQFVKKTSDIPFEQYRLTTDVLKYTQSFSTTLPPPVVYGIYAYTHQVFPNWPEDQTTSLLKASIIRINSLDPGPSGSITLDVKASTKYNY